MPNAGLADRLAASGDEQLCIEVVKNSVRARLLCGPKSSGRPYTDADLVFLEGMNETVASAVDADRLSAAAVRDLRKAREIQAGLLPTHDASTTFAGVDWAALSEPALGVGGDYYDLIPMHAAFGGTRLGLLMADFSGKGIAASLVMAQLRASLRAELSKSTQDVAGLIARLNAQVCAAMRLGDYVTMFYGQYDRRSQTFQYVNAGHNPPLLIRRVGSRPDMTSLDVGGVPLGLMPDAKYQQRTLYVGSETLVFAYSDGVVDAEDVKGESFGAERLCDALSRSTAVPCCARQVLDSVRGCLADFVGDEPPRDDMSMLTLRLVDE